MQVVMSSSVVELLAVAFGGDEVGDEVVGGPRAAFLDVSRMKAAKSAAARAAASSIARVRRAWYIADHRVRPGEELVRHRLGHAEEAGDHDDGHALAVGGEEVDLAFREGVDEGVAERLDLGRQRLDAAVREGAQDEAAQARVAGRFEFEHRMRLDRVEGRDMVGDGPGVRWARGRGGGP